MNQFQSATHDSAPFAPATEARRTVSLWLLLLSLAVFAGLSLLMMFAARVPAIANSINDIVGLPHTAKPDKPDRSTHLLFLLFCYSSPLLMALWVSAIHSLSKRFGHAQSSADNSDEPASPFA